MNRDYFYIIYFALCFSFTSCGYINTRESTEHIARVNNTYLDRQEIEKILPKDLSPEDSIIFINNYINRWATKQLLLENAKQNLPQEKQMEFDHMVKEYQQELYTESYKDMIISAQMDTVITDQEIKTYFEKNKSNFKLNEDLIKLRYIKLSKDYRDVDKIEKRFERFDSDDREKLGRESFKFEDYSSNDSTWLSSKLINNEILSKSDEKRENLLKKDKYIHVSDSLSLYLIFIKDVRQRGEQAPLNYVKPTLKQILLNKRKLQFAKEFEKNITKDALEDDKFEIYD